MNNRLKAGIISGLIAGFVAGIVYSIFLKIAASIELYNPYWRPIIASSVGTNILITVLWGVVFGIIYAKAYGVIPGKGVLKGLVFGLVITLIVTIRGSSFNLAYGIWTLDVLGYYFSSPPSNIAFGLVLGIVYELLLKRYTPTKVLKIKEYDISSGIHPGAIAGLADGLAASIAVFIGPAIGLWDIPSTLGLDLWAKLSQVGTHFFLNLVWGAVFGAIFAKVYNLIPNKGVLKGLTYSLILFMITVFWWINYVIGWALSSSNWDLFIDPLLYNGIVAFVSTGVAFGLALGYLYKPPR